MKHLFSSVLLLLFTITCFAQTEKTKDVFTFRITDYTVKLNDSVTLVQIETPEWMGISDKQIGLLKSNSNFVVDTTTIGHGRCNLIKGTYYYFAIRLSDKKRQPKKADLLYTKVNFPARYKGRIYGLIQHDIYLLRVTEGVFYTAGFTLSGDEDRENVVIDSLAADIRYTGQAMLKQMPERNMPIGSGKYKNKKLFAAMQETTGNDVKDFIDYILYRPERYEGNNWKVSETYATWINSGAPAARK